MLTKFNQNSLLSVLGNIVKVASNQNLDGRLVPISRQLLCQEVWLKLAIKVLPHKLGNSLAGNFGEVRLELAHLLSQRDQAKGWGVGGLEAKELHDTGILFHVSVDQYENGLALELLGSLGELGELGLGG